MDWGKLLNTFRRKDKAEGKSKIVRDTAEFRTEFERDYDRILFSTPVRRLADKTQVFPLEKNDSVRTRLTHSHEVSNLCRSLGVQLAYTSKQFSGDDSAKRNLPAVLAAVGLAHDLGNPPFGHQGEHAIQSWFKENRKVLAVRELSATQRRDFLDFEGNAQTLRILARLQVINDDFGLNLTFGTLAALMKYPVDSSSREKDHVARKKHGYFQSERDIVREIWRETGLQSGVRHPLTYLMEASDDIAYSVLDAEDAVKKGLVSYSDLVAYLRHHGDRDELTMKVLEKAEAKHQEYRKLVLSPAELNDISMQMFRVHAIGAMISEVFRCFTSMQKDIENGELRTDLLTASDARILAEKLKTFDKTHAYRNRSVLEVEAEGYKTIHIVMDFLWSAITSRDIPAQLGSKRLHPFSNYAYGRISENYRRVAESKENKMPLRYREAQLLTDMISGMTDSFAISLRQELERYAAN